MDPYTTAAIREDYERKCARAGLDAEQTARVIGFRLDPWWCNCDETANTVIAFFQHENEDVVAPRSLTAESGIVTVMQKYHITYETLGRNRNVEQNTTARDADELASKVFYFARQHLASKYFEVVVNLDTMRGSIEYGRFGNFAIEVSP